MILDRNRITLNYLCLNLTVIKYHTKKRKWYRPIRIYYCWYLSTNHYHLRYVLWTKQHQGFILSILLIKLSKRLTRWFRYLKGLEIMIHSFLFFSSLHIWIIPGADVWGRRVLVLKMYFRISIMAPFDGVVLPWLSKWLCRSFLWPTRFRPVYKLVISHGPLKEVAGALCGSALPGNITLMHILWRIRVMYQWSPEIFFPK